VPKMSYSTEEKEVIINRAKDYMQRKPDAPRTKVATYAGVGLSVLIRWAKENDFVSVLIRWAKENDFVIPEPITSKQRMAKTPWKGTIV